MSKKRKKKKGQPLKPPRRVYQMPRSKIRPLRTRREEILERAREMPIVGCWRHKQWQKIGETTLLLARAQNDHTVLYAGYLVDLLCLGVKDALVKLNVPRSALQRHVERIFRGDQEPCDAAFAHQLVYGAIAFARKYGFEPHEDFYRLGAHKILDPPGSHPEPYDIKFGKDGKPVYIAGPYDSPSFVNKVLDTLERTAPGKYHFVAPLSDEDLFEDL